MPTYFLIGVIGSKEESLAIKEQIAEFLKEQLKLELSIEKTLITYSGDKAMFLGYEISSYKKPRIKCLRDESKSHIVKGKIKFAKKPIKQRAGYGQIKLTIPKEVVLKKFQELKVIRDINERPWRAIGRTILINNSDIEILDTFNEQIRGLYNYYRLANNVSTEMNKFYQIMKWSLAHTLARKHKIGLTETLTKYHYHSYGQDKDKTIRVIFKDKKDKERIRKFYHEGFKRDEVVNVKLQATVDNINTIWKYMGRTELEKRIKAGKCEVCGFEGKCQVHHINKLKNIKDGKEWWQKLMIARNRKTLIVCVDCHHKIHNGTL